MNWQPYLPLRERHDFTRFNHSPHVNLAEDACATCHEIATAPTAEDTLYRPEFHDTNWMPATDPSVYDSNFSPLLKASCAQCHAEQTRQDSCLTCHNYHIR